MTEAQNIALGLLIPALISEFFLILVAKYLINQLRNFVTEFTNLRITLMTLFGLVILANTVSIGILVGILMGATATGNLVIAEFVSTRVFALASAIGWWFLYNIVEKSDIVDREERVEKIKARKRNG